MLWIGIGIVVLFIIGILFGSDEDTPKTQPDIQPENDRWAAARAADKPLIAEGWSQPIRLPMNNIDDHWGDSLYVAPDGNTIYFMEYPGDLLSVELGKKPQQDPFKGYNADIYKSDKPFMKKEKVKLYYFVENPWSAWGPMIDADGNFFYSSNRYGMDDGIYEGDIYWNDERLPFNKETIAQDNPYYCKARDELWMSFGKDEGIMVLKNAVANNFAGEPELAPAPIQIPNTKQTQPFLTEDCTTLYFASNRDEEWKLAIYVSKRLGEDVWSQPEKVIWNSQYAVGEPTLTADGKKLFYEQVLSQGEGENQEFTTEFFYIEKV